MKHSIVTALSLLFLAAASLAEVSGERPISEPAYGPAPGSRYGTAAASDGRDFLVAWVDGFRNRAPSHRLYAARMNAAGNLLDPLGIHIPTITSETHDVNVVFLGDAYLVYWTESTSTSPKGALFGARISRDGVLLDSTPRLLFNNATVNVGGAASNGNRTVIVSGGRMVVLDRNANVVDGPRLVSSGNPTASASMVASNGRGFLVVSQRGTTIDSTPLDANGVAGSTSNVATTSYSPAVFDLASDGDTYVAIIESGTAVTAQHIGAAGDLLEKSPIPLNELCFGFAFTGGSYLLMDGEAVKRTLGVRRLDRTGQPIGSYVEVTGDKEFSAASTLTSNGSDAGFFWCNFTDVTELLSGTVVSGQSLAASKTVSIADSANAQSGPQGATNGHNNVIIWSELDGLYAGRMTLDGQMLDGRGIRIGGRASAAPGIVYDGTNYVILWAEQVTSSSPPTSLVKLARLSPDSGTLLDPSPVVLATPQCVGGVALAPGQPSTLVAWSDCGHIVANTIAPDGTLGTAVTVRQTENTGSVSATWNGNEWLIVWEDLVNGRLNDAGPPTYDRRIYASRLWPSMAALDRPFAISTTFYDTWPLVASNGDGFLVVWSRYQDDVTLPYRVMAQRVSSDGSLLGQDNGVPLNSGNAKSVVWDGLQYDVAFSSYFYDGTQPYPPPYTLHVTHVAATGSIESLAPQSIVTNIFDPSAALIVTGPAQTIAAYTRLGSEPQYGDVERAFVSIPHALRGRAATPR